MLDTSGFISGHQEYLHASLVMQNNPYIVLSMQFSNIFIHHKW